MTLALPTLNERQRAQWRRILATWSGHLAIWLIGAFFFVPILWMVFTAFKSPDDVFRTPPSLLPHSVKMVVIDGQSYPLYEVTLPDGRTLRWARVHVHAGMATFVDPQHPENVIKTKARYGRPVLEVHFHWENFVDAMYRSVRPGLHVNFWVYLKNSLIIAILSIIGTLVSSTPAAYGFAKVQWPGRDFVFIIVLSTMMLPFQVTMIPLFLIFTEVLHWGDTFLPLVVPTFFGSAFDIFLFRQFFRGIPDAIIDAARIDGASEFQIFSRIILPLSKPVLATITIFTFLWAWNDFLGPLLYLNNPEDFTLALGLQDFQGQRNVAWNLLMAASVVFTLPVIILFFIAQRAFIEGIKLSGVKG